MKSFSQGRPCDCSPVDLRAFKCCEHYSCLVFWHPISVDVYAPYFQQEFGHVLKEGVRDIPGPESFCKQGVLAVLPFQELRGEHLELSFAYVVQTQILAHHGVFYCFNIEFGCGGSSATLMKPCKPHFGSQFWSAVVMMVVG